MKTFRHRQPSRPPTSPLIADHSLRWRVVAHKPIGFRSASASYHLANPGSFRLVPDDSRLEELRKDHRSMTRMFFGSRDHEEILKTLRHLERRTNESAA